MSIFNTVTGGGGGSGLELIEEGTYTQQYNRTSLTIPINTNLKGYGTEDGLFFVTAEPVDKTENNNYVIKCYGLYVGYFREQIYMEVMCLYGKFQSASNSYLNAMYSQSLASNQLYFYANSSSIYFRSGTWNYKIYKIPLS